MQDSLWNQRLALSEAAVTVCCAVYASSSNVGLFSLCQGMLLLTYAAHKLLRVLLGALADSLLQEDLPC